MERATRWTRRTSRLATIHVAIFGDRGVSLPADWSNETVVGIFGDADVDASAAGPEASLTIVGLFADTTIRVAPGTQVRDRGFSLFGDRHIRLAPGEGPPLTLNICALFSDVNVIEAPANTAWEGRSPPTSRSEPTREPA